MAKTLNPPVMECLHPGAQINIIEMGLPDDDLPERQPTPVIELSYYDTLRTILEPYTPAGDEASADKTFSSAEIIKAIEEHHGVAQGPVAKNDIERWVLPEDFTRAMNYLGYKAVNAGGLQLLWLLKNK